MHLTIRTITFVLLATVCAGCPWRWLFGHHGHGHDPDPIACETSDVCDDGRDETLDECGADGFCGARSVTYEADIQAVFQAKCAGCHVDSGTGMCLASTYDSLDMPATAAVCAGLSIAECAQLRIRDGSMPRGRGCTGDPELDAADPRCLTASEHALLDAWIAGGWQETTP
jgi:hypothetical protein